MTITARSITTNNTLEQLRNQFNNLVADVDGLDTGTKAFSAITATDTNTTTLNVLEDGTIVFEGATDDGIGTPLDEFTQFQIKIVMQGTNAAEVPLIKDLRVIALS